MTQDPAINDIRFDIIIRAADTCGKIADQINSIERISAQIHSEHLDHISEDANSIASYLEDSSLRSQAYKALCKHLPELQNIISIPSQLYSYIDQPEKFDDAILLLEYAHDLDKKYADQLPIIKTIYQQTKEYHEHLVINLCNRLDEQKESSQAELKKLVNQITRCGTFTGRDLRLRFLQARDYWFNNECDAKADSFDELISFFCRGLPQIFEEYKGIFSGPSYVANSKLMAMSATSNESTYEDGAIINSWLLLKTSTFILSLEMHLKSLEQSRVLTPTMLGDTIQKCLKLTDWLASIGFDFSSQLKPLFFKSVVSEIKYCIETATVRFEIDFTKIVSKSIESLLLPIDDEILRISSSRPEEQIPKSMGHYPVFKIYFLYIIDSMRWVQVTKGSLSPIGLCLDVYGAMNASLTRVMNALAVVLNMDNNSNHPILSKIAILFLTEVLPFMMNYCDQIFPEKLVLGALGMSKTEFKTICANDPEKVRNFRLDLRQIGHPLRGIMPALMQTIEG